MSIFREDKEGLIVTVFVQPRSSKNAIAGKHGDALKIKLTAPPVDGAANKMCQAYLSKTFNIPKSAITIVSGQTSRTKQVRLTFAHAGDSKKERDRIRKLLLTF